MKPFKFRVTQKTTTYYEGEIEIQASSEEKAREKLNKMRQKKLEGLVTGWDVAEDNVYSAGPIEIKNCI